MSQRNIENLKTVQLKGLNFLIAGLPRSQKFRLAKWVIASIYTGIAQNDIIFEKKKTFQRRSN